MKTVIVAVLVLILGPIAISFWFEHYRAQDVAATAEFLRKVTNYPAQ